MKRYISAAVAAIMTALSFAAGSFCLAADSRGDVKYVIFTDEYMGSAAGDADTETMAALGVMPRGTDMNRFLTRGKAAKYFAAMMGYDYSEKSSSAVYKDVPQDHIYSGAIEVCRDYGIMKSDSEYFRPNDGMSAEETVMLFMDMLGYARAASANGGGSAGYMSFPVYARLISGIKTSGSGITEGQFARIACRAIDENVIRETYQTNQSAVSGAVGTQSFLAERMKMRKVSGRVNAVGEIAFEGYGCREGAVVIGSTQIGGANADITLLGRYVDAYVSDNNGAYSLAGITAHDSSSKSVRLHHTMLIGDSSKYTKLNVVAEENGTETEYKIAQNAAVIFNGRPISEYEKSDICPEYGEMLLVDENDDNEYELVIVWSFEVKQVKYVQNYANGVSCYDETAYSEINDEKTEYVCYRNGEKCALNDLRKYDVLTVAKSRGTENIGCLIYATSDTIEGKITWNDDDYVAIDGVKYRTSPFGKKLKAGDDGVFYADIYGGISQFRTTRGDGYTYGYLLAAGNEGELKNDVVKLFSETGEMLRLSLASKVNVDGVSMRSEDFVAAAALDSLIKYKTNSKGELNAVMYPSSDGLGKRPGYDTEKFSLDWKGSSRFVEAHRSVEGYNLSAENTIIMRIPTYSGAEDDDFYIMDTSYIVSGWQFTFEIYESNEDYEPDIVLVKMGWEFGRKITEWDKNYSFVVSDIETAMYQDELYTKITGNYKGTTESLYVPKDMIFSWETVFGDTYGTSYPCPNGRDEFRATDLKIGDIIQIGDKNSIVNGIRVLYRNDLENPVTSAKYREMVRATDSITEVSDASWHYLCVVGQGTLYYAGDNRVIIKTGDNKYRTMALNLYGRTRYVGMVYDSAKDTVRPATPSDWTQGARIVFHSNYCMLDSILIIK